MFIYKLKLHEFILKIAKEQNTRGVVHLKLYKNLIIKINVQLHHEVFLKLYGSHPPFFQPYDVLVEITTSRKKGPIKKEYV